MREQPSVLEATLSEDHASHQLTTADDGCVVALAGEIDATSAPDLLDWLRAAIDRPGCRNVEIDLSGLRFLDSSGIRSLIQAYGLARARGVRVHASNPQHMVRRVLQLTGVLQMLGVDS
jgi:anti-sigma B factor antagonist